MTAAATPVAASAAPRKSAHAPSADAVRDKGWWKASQWLVLRRFSQLAILALFLLGPLAGVWIVKGNLSSSLTLNTLPLTDPFLLAQVLLTRHWPETSALLGGIIVIVFYALVGGRVFCSWVCPLNMVTDGASWLRRRLNITSGRTPRRALRHWIMAAALAASAITGVTVWEWVNPVSMMHRSLIFDLPDAIKPPIDPTAESVIAPPQLATLGSQQTIQVNPAKPPISAGEMALRVIGVFVSFAWGAVAAVFLFDLLIAPRGWCGHVCPLGAAYHLIGRKSLLRVSARHSSACNDCADCFAVCPEPHIIPVPLKGKGGVTPLILTSECTNCGRCIDVCSKDVFVFTHRFDHRRD